MAADYDPNVFTKLTKIGATTKRTYDYGAKRMMKLDSSKSFVQLLKDPLHCLELLRAAEKKKDKPMSRKTLISTIASMVAYLDFSGLADKDKDLAKLWQKVKGPYNKQDMRKAGSNIPSDRQREAHVPWPIVLRKLKELAQDENQYGSNDHLLLAMFTMIPPRRQLDYYQVHLFSVRDKVPSNEVLKGLPAYIIMKKNASAKMVINKYKTAKAYGSYETTLPTDLVNVIVSNQDKYPDKKYLFASADGKQAYKAIDVFTFWVNSRLKHILNNPKASVNTLRHSYRTFQADRRVSYNQMIADARAMGHSITSSLKYTLDLRSDTERKQQQIDIERQQGGGSLSESADIRTYEDLLRASAAEGMDIDAYINKLKTRFNNTQISA
jgi:hypothetical protein